MTLEPIIFYSLNNTVREKEYILGGLKRMRLKGELIVPKNYLKGACSERGSYSSLSVFLSLLSVKGLL